MACHSASTSRRLLSNHGLLLGLLLGAIVIPPESSAQSMADYSSAPPFISSVVTPNVLVLMDNSGSMANRACDSATCGTLPDGSASTTTSFSSTTSDSGFFASLGYYTYDSSNTRFVSSSTRSNLSDVCASTEWDGNLLNWATFRRFDAVKKAMVGGDCAVARNADGTCPASGSPALTTIRHRTGSTSAAGDTTPSRSAPAARTAM